MTWSDKEDNDEENEADQFHISEPKNWEEPEVGIELPPEPPEPPEMDHELDPETAIKNSKKRVREMLENQRNEPPNQPTESEPSHDSHDRPTEPVTGTPPQGPEINHGVEEGIGEERGRDSLDELNKRIELAESSEDTNNTSDHLSEPDQELVDQILEIHTEIARASDHTEGLDHTLEKLRELLQQQGVQPIEPSPGDELDYYRHQVIETVDSQYPKGTIVEVVRPGYEDSDYVIEEALVRTSRDGN